MQKLLNTNFKKTITGLLMMAAIFSACKKDNSIVAPTPVTPPATSVTTQFASDVISLSENANEGSYSLSLTKATTNAETVVLSFSSATAQYGRDFTTQPAAVNGKIMLNVEKGLSLTAFKVIPVNNNTKDGAREINFSISQEGSIKPQGLIQTKIVLVDDDGNAAVSFAQSSAQLGEQQAQGYSAELIITPAATANGFVEINFNSTNAIYAQHFTTTPALVNGKIRLNIAQGQSRVSFQVNAVNNTVYNDIKTLNFTLQSTSDNLELGAQKQFSLTINDDDTPPVTSIQTLRSSYGGSATYIWGELYISGTVTSVNDNIAPQVMYIQDGTGGIAFRFSGNNPFNAGEMVRIDLQGAVLNERDGALEIQQISPSSVTKIGTEIVVAPTTSIVNLYSTPGNKEGQLVRLSNVVFTQANGSATLQGSRTISDGVRTAIVKTESFASFANRVIPAGTVSVTGILVEQNGQYIILPLTNNSIQ